MRDGDEWVINGQKIFTSLATDADYVWLAVRTNPEASKHKGISMIIVPTDTPGLQGRADPELRQLQHQLHVLRRRAGARTTTSSGEGTGLAAHHQPAQPRAGHARAARASSSGRSTTCAAGPRRRRWPTAAASIDQPWVQHNLARVHARLEVLRLINWKVAWHAEHGDALDPAAASAVKVFGTEFYMEGLRQLLEVLGPAANVRDGLARRRAARPPRRTCSAACTS